MKPELIGRWAVNGAGTIGKIQSIDGQQYVGLTLTGQAWRSMAPQTLAPQYDKLLETVRT